MTFLFNELLWWYTSGDCVMHSTVRFELWWRATCISPPYKQIWTRWNVTQQFTQMYEQCRAVSSEVGLYMIVAAVSVSPSLITNRPKTLITAKMLIPYYHFTHGVSYSTSPVLWTDYWQYPPCQPVYVIPSPTKFGHSTTFQWQACLLVICVFWTAYSVSIYFLQVTFIGQKLNVSRCRHVVFI
jgi:hypothetical protein